MITFNTIRFSSSQPAIAPKFGIIRAHLTGARISLINRAIHIKPGTFQHKLLKLQATSIRLREKGLRLLNTLDDKFFDLRFNLATLNLRRLK